MSSMIASGPAVTKREFLEAENCYAPCTSCRVGPTGRRGRSDAVQGFPSEGRYTRCLLLLALALSGVAAEVTPDENVIRHLGQVKMVEIKSTRALSSPATDNDAISTGFLRVIQGIVRRLDQGSFADRGISGYGICLRSRRQLAAIAAYQSL